MSYTAAKTFPIAHLMALRPRQWTKNLIVFAAPLFAFQIDLITFFQAALAFVLFCCTSSSFYLINDSIDVNADRRHPTKCKRPIASGQVTVPQALFMAGALLTTALTLSWRHSPWLGLTITAYALLQVAYNLLLKHKVLVDIGAIAAGFVLRAYAGAAATGISISAWFLVCTAMLALFLGIEKRKAELRVNQTKGGNTRQVLQRYSLSLLTRMESTVTTGAVLFYALWSAGPVVQGAPTPWMMLTLPFVLYGVFRYQLLSDPKTDLQQPEFPIQREGKGERPEEVLLTDRPMLLTVISWAATVFIILHLHQSGILS
jgi:4-hydroxybenzoate polyprenyltransferase